MRITVNLPDTLLLEAKKIAAREGTTLRMLIEQSLRNSINQRERSPRFRLRKTSFKGHGLSAKVRNAGWDRLRALAYER